MNLLRFLLPGLVSTLSAFAQNAPAPATPAAADPLVLSLDNFKNTPPFSFTYGGKPSSSFLSSWQRSDDAKPVDGGELHTIMWTDPATQLKVTAEVRTFADFPALDWVVTFTNGGSGDTPVIEQIENFDWARPSDSNDSQYQTWYGGNGGGDDFTPGQNVVSADPARPSKFQCAFGRSSRGTLCYFNYLDARYNGSGLDYGPGGVMFGIGWSGGWSVQMLRDPATKTVHFTAGMTATHLVLHAGETIRTPRMVTLCWKGDRLDAPNQWRRFVLRHEAPQPAAGQDVKLPVLFGGGGGTAAERIAQIGKLSDAKLKFDLYGLGGWYKTRGTWTPDATAFPQGLKPVADAARAAGMGVMLSMEPEVADAGSDLLTKHPDWFLPASGDQPAILNFGNVDARKAMTDLVSQLITDTGATYFHHHISDYHLDAKWAAADTPDRVGMTEIGYITGLYQFWDDLQRQHPGLLIDQAGSRLDIEAMRRGTEIWGNTYGQPLVNQTQIAELPKWFPLTAGLFFTTPPDLPKTDAMQLYVWRSSYGPGWTVSAPLPADNSFAQALDEYRRVQPLLLGDFWLLNNYDFKDESGLAWQANRPDLKAGVVLALRREKCPFTAVQPMLRGIDPAATYDVEIKTGLAAGTVQQMAGADLIKIQIPLADAPSSALVFYKQH